MSTLKSRSAVQKQDVFVVDSTQETDLGTAQTTGDGREFRYAYDGGTALVAGKLYQAPAQDTTNYQNLAVSAASTAATLVTITSSATIAANALNGGLMVVTQTPGQGQTYKILSHTAVSSATGCVLTLEDSLRNNLTTSSRIDLHPNIYNGIIISPTTYSSAPVGVAVNSTSGSQYAWIQTKGVVGALIAGTVTAGVPLIPSTGTAGALSAPTAIGTAPIIGIALTGIAGEDYGLVDLNIGG